MRMKKIVCVRDKNLHSIGQIDHNNKKRLS